MLEGEPRQSCEGALGDSGKETLAVNRKKARSELREEQLLLRVKGGAERQTNV